MIQGSDEWRLARAGSLGASQISDALARTRTGSWGASRENTKTHLVVERLTGKPKVGYVSQAMANGIEREPKARQAYVVITDAVVEQVGLIKHPTIPGTHASPDGLVGSKGILEIKCPEDTAHKQFLRTKDVSQRYYWQMQWQLCCCQRQWADFVSWHPDFPIEMQLFIKRVPRDDTLIAKLEKEVMEFLAEVEAETEELYSEYIFGRRAA